MITEDQKAQFARILGAQRQQIRYDIDAWRERADVGASGDGTDDLRGHEEQKSALRNLARLAALLRQVDSALTQLRDGTYGVCAGCGSEIPLRRLQAAPWSAFCSPCQKMIETTRPLEDSAPVSRWKELVAG
jgi:DnaK suppressor protein